MTTFVPERRKGNLPAEVTSSIGRRRELSRVRYALEQYRLVTLRGWVGSGRPAWRCTWPVDSHIEHIFGKLGFTSRTQLAAWVSRQNAS